VNLAEENDILRELVVDCADGTQGLLHRIILLMGCGTLFPLVGGHI